MNMMRFKVFISESVNNQRLLKKYIETEIKKKGIKTSSGRGGLHIRFPLDDDPKKLQTFFSKLGVSLTDYDKDSISGKFRTYNLTINKSINGIPKGTTIPWVNNNSKSSISGGQMFSNKELTPEAFGLAGKTLTQKQIMTIVAKQAKKKYDASTSAKLIALLKQSQTRKNVIQIDPALGLKSSDLTTLSADYGEIMAAIWAMSSLRFKSAYFPTASNEPLIDFYGIRLGVQYPISVKSGGGGKVTVQNIINAIEKRAKTASSSDLSDEKSLVIFKTVNNNSMKDGMIELHKVMKTPAIKELSKVTGISIQNLSAASLGEWTKSFESNEKLAKALGPFWKTNQHGTPTERIINGNDRMRLIISPLGESIWKILNSNAEIKTSLTNVARQVTLIQTNVDVKNNSIKFQSNFFKHVEFEFGWAGYAGGNKLGFKMNLKK